MEHRRSEHDDPIPTGGLLWQEDVPTNEEGKLRRHAAAFVLVLLDPDATDEQRDNAARHLIECQPARALALLALNLREALAIIEEHDGVPRGSAVADMRRSLHGVRRGA
jgi:hypothetical protein